MAGRGPSPDQVRRFRADLEALAGSDEHRFGLAVSGGPDSLALLLLAREAARGAVAAATVDHGLRPEAAAEAEFAGQVCRRLDVPHAVLRPDVPITGNLQAAARQARYARLESWREAQGLDWILTAHHADDQVETLLMRLNRGAGVGGLGGVRIRNGRVLRPLLSWHRAELAGIVSTAGLEAVDDPSNTDARFDRARLRAQLADAGWIDADGFARSALALAEAEEALAWTASRLADERVAESDGQVTLDPADLPAELRRRLLSRVIERIAPGAAPRGDELGRLLATLDGGGTATLAGVKCRGGPVWRFEAAPPRRPRKS